MPRTPVFFCVLLASVTIASPILAVSTKLAKETVKEFNTERRATRTGHLMLPVNFVEHESQSYAYYLPRRMKRLAEEGATFDIRKLKTKTRHVILEIESDAGAKLDLLLYDNEPLTQSFVDSIVPLMIRTLFEFGDAPALPPLVGNSASQLLHLGSCNHLPVPDERVVFEEFVAAESAGYRRCPACFTSESMLPIENYGSVRLEAIERSRLFELAFPPVEDEAVQSELRAVGEKVLSGFPLDLVGFDYQFNLVHSVIPQAVAFPTGFIFVTDSLLDMVEHEAEIEFVIAHEVAHCELNLPPIGSAQPFFKKNYAPSREYYTAWERHQETVADLIALRYLHELDPDGRAVFRARNILAKLQFSREGTPGETSTGDATHPSFASRLALFRSKDFEAAPSSSPFEVEYGRKKLPVMFTVLAKVRGDKGTYIYLLVEASDLANETWEIDSDDRFAELIDARGRTLSLRSDELHHRVGPGEIDIIRAKIGDHDLFDQIDLVSGPLEMKEKRLELDW